jgi:ABC-type transport system substrate-binding protein
VQADGSLQFVSAVSQGYQGITVNLNNGARSENPFGKDARVRKALSLAIDREAINQVVFEGTYAAGNQHVPPSSPWYDETHPVEARDIAAARALLDEAGVDRLSRRDPGRQQPGADAADAGDPVDGGRGRLRRVDPRHRVRLDAAGADGGRL